jgi:hypothetical protein
MALGVICVAPAALSNGRFPEASLITFQPSNPAHFLVRTTFGLLESSDAGVSFDWTCEAALGLGDREDPMVAITEHAVRVVATRVGVVTSADGCSWAPNRELIGKALSDLTLARNVPGRVLVLEVAIVSDGAVVSQLLASEDDGASFATLGGALPDGLLGVSVDVAPSDSARVYLTARRGLSDGYASVLLRSSDGGISFEALPIPRTNNQKLAYIAAIHPRDPDGVYVRVNDAGGTAIWMSADGGDSFKEVMTGMARLSGFAISPDGQALAVGGPADGVWVGASDGSLLEQRSSSGPTCLGWSEDGLYACGGAGSAFAVGRSIDGGATFVPLLSFADVCGTGRCSAATQVGAECPMYFPEIAPAIGASCGAQGISDGGGNGERSAATAEPIEHESSGCSFGSHPERRACLLIALALAASALRRQ